MAYIYKPTKNKNYKKNKTEKVLLRQKLYNNSKWHKLRQGFLITHPLCSKCGGLAEHVHHINSPFADGLSDEERLGRLLNPFNLEAMCARCHGDEHSKKKKNVK